MLEVKQKRGVLIRMDRVITVSREFGSGGRELGVKLAEKLDIPLVQLYDILTFYAMLETKPRGRYIIEVCNNAPCYVSKSHVMAKFLRKELGINFGETTPDGMFSLQYMPCVGACNIGPVIKIGDKVYGNLNEERIRKILRELRENDQ